MTVHSRYLSSPLTSNSRWLARDHVRLGVHDQHHVGLVGERRTPAQVPRPHPLTGLQALLVGGRDGEDRCLEVDRQVLQLLGDLGDALLVGQTLVVELHLLQVVDDDQFDGGKLRELLVDPSRTSGRSGHTASGTRATARCNASIPTSLPSNMLIYAIRRTCVVFLIVAAIVAPRFRLRPGGSTHGPVVSRTACADPDVHASRGRGRLTRLQHTAQSTAGRHGGRGLVGELGADARHPPGGDGRQSPLTSTPIDSPRNADSTAAWPPTSSFRSPASVPTLRSRGSASRSGPGAKSTRGRHARVWRTRRVSRRGSPRVWRSSRRPAVSSRRYEAGRLSRHRARESVQSAVDAART